MAEIPKQRAWSPTLPPPPPAIFYGPVEYGNPVVERFETDLRSCLGFLRKAAGSKEQELHRRGATALFHIWNNYKLRFPDSYYIEKLVEVGDQLVEMKEYRLALSQCYERYLQGISSMNINEVGLDVHVFKSNFFPNGFRNQNAAHTFHVLQTRHMCIYKIVCANDKDLMNQESVKTCYGLLAMLQLIMQMTLPHEHLCWLVYNGTIHMYTICRHLMTIGHSAKVLEYLLWACICMESSVPLLAVHHLTWRATLYAAVCQCYYDCGSGIHGEVFARRGLVKIDELKQMEIMSSPSLSTETKRKFKEATVKMATMIFKRSAFEPRRRSKGVFRPRIRANLKEAQHMPWPRTTTERLLMEMFDCNSALFFAILEALFDRNRRALIPSPPVPDEAEVREVVSELFFAGMDLLEGGGVHMPGSISYDFSNAITERTTLMEQILSGKNGIPADAALRFIKLAFSYEDWDTFDHTAILFFSFLQSHQSPEWAKASAELKLLLVMQPLVSTRKPRHGLCLQQNNIKESPVIRSPGRKSIAFQEGGTQSPKAEDDLFLLAKTLFSCVCASEKTLLPDREMIIDATMFLWQKCKPGIYRIQMSGSNFIKFIHKYHTPKWIHILYIINEVIHTVHLGDSNAVVMAEVALRLSSVMESIADFTIKSGTTTALKQKNDILLTSEYCIGNMTSLIQRSPPEQLHLAYDCLERAINAMNRVHLVTLLLDGTSVLDNCSKKATMKDQNANLSLTSDNNEKSLIGNNFIMDLHVELIQAQHRVAIKLLNLEKDVEMDDKNIKFKPREKDIKQFKRLTESDILNKIKKNKLSKALYLMQKATLMLPAKLANSSPDQLLEEALTLIQKADAEQKSLCTAFLRTSSPVKSKVPPPPILIARSHCSMVFKPAQFTPEVKVSWYSIFGCVAQGSNLKVRLNDYNLKNTAEVVPMDETCLLKVEGLEPNQSYIFAVAAYDSDGKLVGDSIGESTKPILAYPPLSSLTVRAYLVQTAFQIEYFALSKKAFQPLWNFFILTPSTPVTNVKISSISRTLAVPRHRINPEALSQASPNLLYLFTRSIFIISDISVIEGALFCDSVCVDELKYSRQVARIAECGKMLVAVELSNWLNDTNYALQSVVHCYGLIAPLIYHRIPSKPVIQIIIKCLTVLQEIPSLTLQRRPAACYESIQHMIACSSFFTVKVLREWKEYDLAIIIISYGKRLLDSAQTASQMATAAEGGDEAPEEEIPSKSLKAQIAAAVKVNENLEALEANLLKLTKPGQELSGEEDVLLLYPVVANWQTKNAYREVLKFKKSPRFLEYFVKIVYKALNEEKFSRVIEWADEIQDYLKKRNKYVLGVKRSSKKMKSKPGAKKSSGLESPKTPEQTATKQKAKVVSKKVHTKAFKSGKGKFDAKRKGKDESRRMAFARLLNKLNLTSNVFLKRRRFRRIYVEEMPWRCQLNIYLAVCHFHLLRKRIEEFCEININSLQNLNSYDELDPEIFSLKNSGTIVVTATTEEEMKTFKSPLFKLTPSGKIRKKNDPFDTPSPAFDPRPSTCASDQALLTPSLDTISSSSILLDYCNCSSPENDTMVDAIDFIQLSSASDSDPHFSSVSSTKFSDKESPRLPQGYVTVKERERAQCYNAMQDHFAKIFLNFRRAVVIAHRGAHWTLLQNVCRDLWNYTQEVQSIIKHSSSFHAPFPICKDSFYNTIWLSYYMASDALLDMIVDLQASNSVKIIEPEGDFCVPSCVGSIADDEGGSNLSFEYPFDDVTVVDLQGVYSLILRTLELLFYLKKWESLVYIAMQFNTVTHERYTEQVTSLMVFAQRQLLERAQLSVSKSAQPHFTQLVTTTGHKVRCRDFVGIKLHAAAKCYGTVDECDFASPGLSQASVSVPLDVTDSLKCFNDSLEKSKYHSRALKHSRKLLGLFVAHTQSYSGGLNRESSQVCSHGKVGFVMGAELTYQPEPPDLSKETFSCLGLVQSNPISRSKLPVVVSSYERTLEVLQSNNQQDLRVQAFHELGNLHFYAGNKRAAFKCWCQGLDEVLKTVDALNHWQELDGLSENAMGNLANRSQVYCEKFLSCAGIWGCLLGAVLAAKIARYILLYDVKLRTKTCILSATLFKSLLRASLPHPKADCDFAFYEADVLIPGIDLFTDYYRADIATVVASMSFIMYELHFSKQNLIILPLFPLYQYFVSEVCRNEIKCIEGRILKIRALAELGFFSDAFNELCAINRGKKIPWKLPSVYKLTSNPSISPKFDLSQHLLENVNLQALEDIFNRTVHSAWCLGSEPRIMDHLLLAKTHLIICISETLNCIPEKVMRSTYCVDSETLRKAGRNTDAFMKGFIMMAAVTTTKREPLVMIVELEKNKEILTVPLLKGILLQEAEERINSVLEVIQNKYGLLLAECSATELEVVIEAKLQLAAIAQQRLQTAYSAALAFSAIKLLQDANIFKKTPSFPQNREKINERSGELIYVEDSNLPHNVIAREHINIHVWMKCRLALVTAMTAQARGIEIMKENELTECSCLTKEVQMEAEAFNDAETLAEITMQAVMLKLQERQPVADIKLCLQTIIRSLEDKTLISPPASLTLVQSMLLLSDIMRTQAQDDSEDNSSKIDQLNLLITAHKLVIDQLYILGQPLEQHTKDPTMTTLVDPLKNIYLPHIRLLAKVKLRIGHALTLELFCATKPKSELQWQQALQHTETALDLCTSSMREELELEAELLFRKGKIERQIDLMGGNRSSIAVNSFLDAINLTLRSYQNYGLIRRAYMEIALLFFYLITNKEENPCSSMVKGRTFKPRPPSRHRVNFEEITAQEMYRVQAWIAIRAAAQVSEAILTSQQLIGKKAVKLYHVRHRVLQNMPEFALLDLSSSYKDFLSEGYEVCYKVPVMSSAQEEKSESDGSDSVSSEESLTKLKIPWVHVLRYNTYLTRLLNMSPLLAVPNAGEGLFAKEDVLFTSVFDTTIVLRLTELHSFLKSYLPIYCGCCVQNPPSQLYGLEKPCFSLTVLRKSTTESIGSFRQRTSADILKPDVPWSSEQDMHSENKATTTPTKELCVQWYLPSLEKSSRGGETMVLFIFAYNTKPVKIINIKSFSSANIYCGYLWIPLSKVIAVCEKLSYLKVQIEMLMLSAATTQSEREAQRKYSVTPPKVPLDEKTKEMLMECFSEIKTLLSVDSTEASPLTELPFDVTLPAIKNLRKLFEPANGCVVIAGNVFNWIVSLLT